MILIIVFFITGILIGWFLGNLIDGFIWRIFHRENLRNYFQYGKGKKYFDDEHL